MYFDKRRHPMDNLLLVLGHPRKESEIKYTPQGTPITTFSVAANYLSTKLNAESQPPMAESDIPFERLRLA
jgi:hypothetical protein